MITCPVCNSENNHLAVICRSCGGFLQSKIDNLDLFTTVWKIVESPKAAFHRIAIASHKNYSLLLGGLMGVGLAFALMWLLKVGNANISLLNLLIAGFLLGPILGIVALLLLAGVQKTVAWMLKLQTKYKNAMAVASYATVPIVFSVIFILPIEILTFGKFFFSTNPSPFLIKPVSYVLVLVLDGLCIGWTLILYYVGVKVLYNLNTLNALFVSSLTLAIFFAFLFLCISALVSRQDESMINKYLTAEVVRWSRGSVS